MENKEKYLEFPKFEGTKEEKIIQFLNFLNFEINVFDDLIGGYKKVDLQNYIVFYKLIIFSLKDNKVKFNAIYSEMDIYPDNFNELIEWETPELVKVANDLIK